MRPVRWTRRCALSSPALATLAGAWALLAPASAHGQDAPSEEPPAAPAEDAPAAPAEKSERPEPELVPPRLLEASPAPYPDEEAPPADGAAPRVLLRVTLDEAGAVTDAVVVDAPSDGFAREALRAVRSFRFAPARSAGVPIASQVPVEVRFAPPAAEAHPSDVPAPPEDAAAPPSQPTAPNGAADAPMDDTADDTAKTAEEPEYSARGVARARELRSRARGAADFEVGRDVLDAAPHRDASDMLRTVPGIYVARAEGFAVAPRITLRGFDADHGQDIEMLVDGVPINQPSHIHGQGYADVNFLIPEVIREIRATEGVYDPRQGDFATAGTLDFTLGVEERGIHSATTYGSFDTFRQTLVYAPEGKRPDTFGAVGYRSTSGFGRNRGGQDASAIAQYGFGEGGTRYRVTAMLSGARFAHAGVLRLDDIEDGSVSFHGVYAYPTARAQSALAARSQLSFAVEDRGADGQVTEALLWTTLNDFRIQQNFTGFLQRSSTNLDWYGRGDLIAQENEQLSFGARARHRTAAYRPTEEIRGTIEIGLATRLDRIEQSQRLVQAPQNRTWDESVDASITGADVGSWLDLDWQFGRRVHLRGGLRADALFYEVEDRLGNFIPAYRQDQYILGFRRSAMGLSAGPRVSTEIVALPWLTAIAAYGEGYRSPQARTLADGEKAPFTKVRSADVGARGRWGEAHELSLSSFWTHVGDDVAFDATEGRLEPIGPTTRLGVVLFGVSRPADWLLASGSVTVVRATLDEPPRATAADPLPAFESGAALPFVAPVTGRVDLAATPTLLRWGNAPVQGRAGVGYSYLSPRPLPFGQRASAVSLVDAQLGARWRELELLFEVHNLFDSDFAASEFNFVSHWDPAAVPSRVPARHIAAGAPRTFLATLGVHL